jgi:2-oxoglutarate dehydrogenase E2 component (dihydrolipoamide succinyltransferase)
MAQIEIILPTMGEGIIEAEITRWLVREGDHVETDTPVVEVATDKVDSEIPSPGTGIIIKILSVEGDVPKVGQVIALISTGTDTEGRSHGDPDRKDAELPAAEEAGQQQVKTDQQRELEQKAAISQVFETPNLSKYAFLSPVIRKMARDHNVSPIELEKISGTGLGSRITRSDFLAYLEIRETENKNITSREKTIVPPTAPVAPKATSGNDPGTRNHLISRETRSEEDPATKKNLISRKQIYGSGESTIEEMDRMRKLIADHMVYSMQTAPHVTSFVESDVTAMMIWRERVKDKFLQKYHQKLTITTLIMEAVARNLKEFPGINVSLDDYHIIRKSSINIGMATALPDGNLIVPVIRDVDQMNLAGLATAVNDLADRARSNKLRPAEIQGGTFTVTNLGNFGNIAGTPVINQPEVAILAVGAIRKKPAIVKTPQGDAIGIRQIMILSMAYDHRIVDGALGGSFLKSIGNTLQNFDTGRSI